MTPKQIALCAAVWFSTTAAPVAAQSPSYWVGITDPSELRALHTNKTHKGLGGDGISFVAYYRADGKALLIRAGERIARTWEIKGGDRVCYSDERFPGCRRFQRARANPSQLNVTHEDGWSALFNVEDGIPAF